MFGLSGTEIAIILVLALLLLGPDKLPELARSIGKGVRDFRRATDDVRHSVEAEFYRMDIPKDPSELLAPKPPENAPIPANTSSAEAVDAAPQAKGPKDP